MTLAPFAAHEALMTPELKDSLTSMRQQLLTGSLVITTQFDPLLISPRK